MWFLILLSWLSNFFYSSFFILCFASGLYYLAELVEEYTVLTCKIIRYLIVFTFIVYVGLLIFETFPIHLILCGIANQIFHLLILKNFPYINLLSPAFISSLVFLIINHFLAFSHFANIYYSFNQIVSYFTLCLWLVPFSFFISLSANENVLPVYNENRSSLSEQNDVISHYFSRKGQKNSLLTFFNYVKKYLFPEKMKKSF